MKFTTNVLYQLASPFMRQLKEGWIKRLQSTVSIDNIKDDGNGEIIEYSYSDMASDTVYQIFHNTVTDYYLVKIDNEQHDANRAIDKKLLKSLISDVKVSL